MQDLITTVKFPYNPNRSAGWYNRVWKGGGGGGGPDPAFPLLFLWKPHIPLSFLSLSNIPCPSLVNLASWEQSNPKSRAPFFVKSQILWIPFQTLVYDYGGSDQQIGRAVQSYVTKLGSLEIV